MAETEGEMIHRAHASVVAAEMERVHADHIAYFAALKARLNAMTPAEHERARQERLAELKRTRDHRNAHQRAELRATIAASLAIVQANTALKAIADGSFNG